MTKKSDFKRVYERDWVNITAEEVELMALEYAWNIHKEISKEYFNTKVVFMIACEILLIELNKRRNA